jgi:hypothetical protein
MIYVLSSPSRPAWYKIGRTTDLVQRLATFHTADPDLRVMWAIEVPDSISVETALHRLYQLHRRPGTEWFYLELPSLLHLNALLKRLVAGGCVAIV